MDKKKIVVTVVKTIGGVVITVGIGAVTANLIKTTTPADIKRLTKICVKVGSFLVAGLAIAKSKENFNDTIDLVDKLITKLMERRNEIKHEEIVGGET